MKILLHLNIGRNCHATLIMSNKLEYCLETFLDFQNWNDIQVKEFESYIEILHSNDPTEKVKYI